MNGYTSSILGMETNLDRVRQALEGSSQSRYANTTVFVEQASIDPMAALLKQVLEKNSIAALKESADELQQQQQG